MSRRAHLTLPILLAILLAPSIGHGRNIIKYPHRGARPYQLDLHAGFAYAGEGLAVGGRFGFPIVKNGFIPSINNAVYINVGADLYFIRDGTENNSHDLALGIPVTLHWEFYFTPQWSAFAEAGPNFFFHPAVFRGDGWKFSGDHWISAGVGGRFFIKDTFALTLRVGNPYSAFGVSFFF